MTPQARTVLRHLREVGSITNVEANAVHKIRSVSRRITEIQDAGFPVTKHYKTDSTGQRYVKYVLDTTKFYAPVAVSHPVIDFSRELFRAHRRAVA